MGDKMPKGCRDNPHIFVLMIDELNQVASCGAIQDVCPIT